MFSEQHYIALGQGNSSIISDSNLQRHQKCENILLKAHFYGLVGGATKT